jgi:WD40 repeat protein
MSAQVGFLGLACSNAMLLHLPFIPTTDSAIDVVGVVVVLDEFDKRPELLLQKIWEKRLASPVKYLKYSPDGLLFASRGDNDRIVKVWQEVKSLADVQLTTDSPCLTSVDFDCVYLTHPRAVTNFSWRRISQYLPKGVISNSLLTSCKDNVCRIWSETVISDDGLTYSLQEEVSYTSVEEKAVRHKKNFLHKLHKIR